MQAATQLIADAVSGMFQDWEEGRAASPAASDFVLAAEQILSTAAPGHQPVDDSRQEEIAELLYAQQEAGACQEPEEIARFLVEQLTR